MAGRTKKESIKKTTEKNSAREPKSTNAIQEINLKDEETEYILEDPEDDEAIESAEDEKAKDQEKGEKNTYTLLYIVDILKKNSDASHPLSVKQIQDIMQDYPYCHYVSDRSIERKMSLLRNFYMPEFRVKVARKIDRSRSLRADGKKCASNIYKGYYYEARLTDVEYRLLMDSVLFSRFITADQVKEIAEKISPMVNKEFADYTPIVRKPASPFFKPKEDYIQHIGILSEAIRKKLVVKMVYGEYSFNNRLVSPEDPDPKEFHAHSLIFSDGEYYVLGQWADETLADYSAYKVSRIRSVEIVKDTKYPNIYHSYSAGEYITRHPKMQVGKPVNIVLKVKDDRADLIVENFGNEYSVAYKDLDNYPEYDGYFEVRLKANPEDVYRIALENADAMEVILPQTLRHKISDIGAALEYRYNLTNDDKYLNAITPTTVEHRAFRPTGDKRRDALRKKFYDKYSRYGEKNLDLAGIDLNGKCEYKDMTDKEVLRLGENNIKDYSFLQNFTKVEKMLWCGPLPEDTSWLAGMTGLRILYLTPGRQSSRNPILIPDLKIFNRCQSLEYLMLSSHNMSIENPGSLLELDLPNLKGIEIRRKEVYAQFPAEILARFKEKFPDVEIYAPEEKHEHHPHHRHTDDANIPVSHVSSEDS